MKAGTRPLGYTIIEVMIVLAVSGVMFLIAASFINGKQARTAFSTGVNDLASQIQNVINQVSDGQYSEIPITCNPLGGVIHFVNSTNSQGTNSSCVFLGKALQFIASGDPTQYQVFSIAGKRLDPNNSPVSSTTPEVIQESATPIAQPYTTGPDLTQKVEVPQALMIDHVTAYDINGSTSAGGGANNNVIVFLQGLPGVQNSTFKNGAQTVSMYYARGATSDTESGGALDINNGLQHNPSQLAQSATICVTDGTRYADINIGTPGTNPNPADNSAELNVAVQVVGSQAVC